MKETKMPGKHSGDIRLRGSIRHRWMEFFCVLPALLLTIVVTYYPIGELIRISFTNWNLLKDDYTYVGFKNWDWIINGTGAEQLRNTALVTIKYTLGELVIVILGGFMLAVLFNHLSRSFSFMRAIVFMPRYVAMSTAGIIFLWLLNENYGIINFFLTQLGGTKVAWVSSKDTAMLSVLMLTGWRAIGYGMIIYLSAMQGISKDYYESASLDGANSWQQIRNITLPLLAPTTLFLFITQVISSMKVYQSVDVLTGGGPYRSTEVIVYFIYRLAFVDYRVDRAAVVAVIFFVTLIIFTAVTMKSSNKNVNYDS